MRASILKSLLCLGAGLAYLDSTPAHATGHRICGCVNESSQQSCGMSVYNTATGVTEPVQSSDGWR